MQEIIIDKETLKLLDEMGFIPSTKSPKLYEIEIKDGFAYVDFRKVDGRRFAMVKGKPVDDEDSIPILKAFKERRDEIKNKLLNNIGASTKPPLDKPSGDPNIHSDERSKSAGGLLQSSPKEHDGKEVYDTTKGKDSKDEKDKLLIHAPGGEPIKTSGAEFPQKTQPESQDNKQDSHKTKVEGETILQNRTQTTPTPIGTKSSLPPTPIKEQQPIPPAASQSPNLYEFFFELVEAGGIIELYAPTGFLKTTVCVKTVCDAVAKGKKAFFIDTEGKVGIHNKKMLKKINSYSYLPIWVDIVKAVETLGNYDVLVIDSIGFPISAKASGMNMREQGEAWNAMMSLVGDVAKAWAFKNNAIVLFTNQPKSEMMKSEEELKRLDAVGDKVHFAPTVILRAIDKVNVPGKYDASTHQLISLPETTVNILSHRNPDFRDDTIMLKVYKSDETVRIVIPENVQQRLKVLKA